MTSHQPDPLIDTDGVPFNLGDYVVVDDTVEGMVTRRLDNGNILVDLERGFYPVEASPADVALSRFN